VRLVTMRPADRFDDDAVVTLEHRPKPLQLCEANGPAAAGRCASAQQTSGSVRWLAIASIDGGSDGSKHRSWVPSRRLHFVGADVRRRRTLESLAYPGTARCEAVLYHITQRELVAQSRAAAPIRARGLDVVRDEQQVGSPSSGKRQIENWPRRRCEGAADRSSTRHRRAADSGIIMANTMSGEDRRRTIAARHPHREWVRAAERGGERAGAPVPAQRSGFTLDQVARSTLRAEP